MTCSVCGAVNPDTATICSSCKAFLQNRVPTLDLFRTAWGILVAPSRTFHEIALAEHKNYALTLFGFSGIPLVASTVAAFQAGGMVGGLIETAAAVIAAGFVVGNVLGILTTLLHMVLARLVRGDSSFRRSLGVVAYSLVPATLVGLLIYPIQLLSFGEHWFVANPHPATINPVSYWGLIAMQVAAVAWTVVVLIMGSRVCLRVKFGQAFFVGAATSGIIAAGWVWSVMAALRLLEAAQAL